VIECIDDFNGSKTQRIETLNALIVSTGNVVVTKGLPQISGGRSNGLDQILENNYDQQRNLFLILP
jgi:hypothetical protein